MFSSFTSNMSKQQPERGYRLNQGKSNISIMKKKQISALRRQSQRKTRIKDVRKCEKILKFVKNVECLNNEILKLSLKKKEIVYDLNIKEKVINCQIGDGLNGMLKKIKMLRGLTENEKLNNLLEENINIM